MFFRSLVGGRVSVDGGLSTAGDKPPWEEVGRIEMKEAQGGGFGGGYEGLTAPPPEREGVFYFSF